MFAVDKIINLFRGSFGERGNSDRYFHVEPLDRRNTDVCSSRSLSV